MITQAYSQFFQGLKANNHKEWFHANKKAYEHDVKQPFLSLVEALIEELSELEPDITPDPKKALFRINRDIRFSKDKTPYNTMMKAGLAPGGKKSTLPGFYLGIDADQVHVGGGLFGIATPDLKKIRMAIAEQTDDFVGIVEGADFKARFGALKGERAKRLDKAFQPVQAQTPYIANKQFFAMQEIPLAPLYESDTLLGKILEAFRAIHPLNVFLKEALMH